MEQQIEISNRTQSVVQNESEILKILKHPGIPTLYDIQKDEKYYYLIEEFFEGEVLSSYIHKQTGNIKLLLLHRYHFARLLLHNIVLVRHNQVFHENSFVSIVLPYMQ